MERTDDGDFSFFDGKYGQHRRQRRVHVHDVVLARAQDATHITPERSSYGDAPLRSIDIKRNAPADPNDAGPGCGTGNMGRDDVDVVSQTPGFAREKMDVFAHAPQVRIVVLRDERDAHGCSAAANYAPFHKGWSVIGGRSLPPSTYHLSPITFTCRKRRMRGSEPGDRHAVRGTRDVVHADGVTEEDRARIAAVLTADAHLQRVAHAASRGDRELDEL